MIPFTDTQWVLIACLLVALPLWLIGLWRAASVIESAGSLRRPRRPRLSGDGFTLRLKLFLGGTLLLFAGFLSVVLFRDAVYAAGIAAGTLFLTGLFFACYFRNLSDDERQLFGARRRQSATPEEVLLVTHPTWSAEHPGLFVMGVGFTVGGAASAVALGDLALLLLTVFGLVFQLHLWSFCQLNTLIVTNRVTATREGLPAERCRLIRHRDVQQIEIERTGLDRLFRVSTLTIAGDDDAPVRIKLKNPGEVKRLIEEFGREEAEPDVRAAVPR